MLIKDSLLPWGAPELADMVHCVHGPIWTQRPARDDQELNMFHIDGISSLQTRWQACQQDSDAEKNLEQELKREFIEQRDVGVELTFNNDTSDNAWFLVGTRLCEIRGEGSGGGTGEVGEATERAKKQGAGNARRPRREVSPRLLTDLCNVH